MTDEPSIWLPVIGPIIEGDVLRWTQVIWSDKKQGRGRDKKHVIRGKQSVTAQITNIDNDFITLKVIEAEITESNSGRPLHPHKPEEIIRKKLTTLTRGNLERLIWSDETARHAIITQNEKS
jgi:hypothetical protein